MTNPFDIRRESDTFDGLFIVYDVRDGQTCRSFPFTVKRVSGEEYIPATVAQAQAEDFAAELWARELADAPIVEPTDNAPASAPEAPTLTETFTPAQFPSVEAIITPTSVITLTDRIVDGTVTVLLVVDGVEHDLLSYPIHTADDPPAPVPATRIEYNADADLFVAYVDGGDYPPLMWCNDALEAALQVRDRLLRLEFEAQVADEPPVPVPATRIEYDHNADLFVAYVDGVERTAAPTQAEVNAALEAQCATVAEVANAITANAVASVNAVVKPLEALREGDIVRDALGDVHRVAHIGNGVLPVVTFRAGRLCWWRECDLVKMGG